MYFLTIIYFIRVICFIVRELVVCLVTKVMLGLVGPRVTRSAFLVFLFFFIRTIIIIVRSVIFFIFNVFLCVFKIFLHFFQRINC